jgi:hypothetical protein
MGVFECYLAAPQRAIVKQMTTRLAGRFTLAAMRKAGVGLVVAAHVVLLYTSLAAPAYARAHSYLDPAMLAAYAAPWPVALASAVVVAGIMMALIPLRRGERWALWTELAVLILLLVTRLSTDPRCLVVLDPHQHGCHSFMIAVVAGVIGLVLCWR